MFTKRLEMIFAFAFIGLAVLFLGGLWFYILAVTISAPTVNNLVVTSVALALTVAFVAFLIHRYRN